jgi:hypothetical protein
MTFILGLVVGVLVGWHTGRPVVVDIVVARIKGLLGK